MPPHPRKRTFWVDLKSPAGTRTFVRGQCKPSKQFICELRKGVVARAHDYDAITTVGQPNQHVATGTAVWKSKSLSAAPLDLANNIVAADATVDRAAEVNGLGHDQNILIVEPACEAAH